MKTTEILIAQFMHINSNIIEYLKMSLPLIFFITVVLGPNSPLDYYLNNDFTPTISIMFGLFSFLVSVYTVYLYFRYYVNLHRFIIMEDKLSYHSPLKNIKVTLFYFLYLILGFFFALLVLFSSQILNEFFPSLIIFQFGIGLMLLFILVFLYPFYGLALPQIAIGEKISLRKIFRESKGTKETLFYQFLILYVPAWFLGRVITEYTYFNQNYIFSIISTLVSVYLTTMFVGCLSRTYILSKEARN